MKRLALLLALSAFPLLAQVSSPSNQSRVAGRFVAYNYGQWTLPIYTMPTGTGSKTFTLSNSTVQLGDGRVIMPFNTNAQINVGTETVTLTAVGAGCIANSTITGGCSLTATFAQSHTTSDRISPATFGLQEALNDAGASGGGAVTVDSAWTALGGTTAMVNAATKPANTGIEDARTGTPSGGGSGGGPYVNVTAYGAVPDASTDNKSAFTAAMVAVNAITTGTPTLYLPCTSAGCKYNCNDAGSQCLSLANTHGVSMKCDQGVEINDTGSAHIVQVGDGSSIYTDFGPMTIDGCYFVGASVTAAIYAHPGTGHMETLNISNNQFTLPTASTAILGDGGSVYTPHIISNTFSPPALAGGNFVDLGIGDGYNNMIYAYGNKIYCGRNLTTCTAGFGIRVYGYGSIVAHNIIADMNPDIQCMVGPSNGQGCSNSTFSENNMEVNTNGVNAIQFGSSGDAGKSINGVKVIHNYTHMHGVSTSMVGMGSTTDTLWGTVVRGNSIEDTAQPVITLNNLEQQGDNIADANMCSTAVSNGTARCPLPVHQTVSNGTTFEPWLEEDNRTFADTFNVNGALTAPYFNTGGNLAAEIVASHILTCGGCAIHSSYDLPANQYNRIQISSAPTSGGYIGIDSRYTYDGVNVTEMYCYYTTGTGVKLGKTVAGTSTQLGSTYVATAPVAGDWLGLRDIGTLHECILNHAGVETLILSAVDSDVTVGYGGFGLSNVTPYTTAISAFVEQGMP